MDVGVRKALLIMANYAVVFIISRLFDINTQNIGLPLVILILASSFGIYLSTRSSRANTVVLLGLLHYFALSTIL